MRAPGMPSKRLADLSKAELRRLYDRVQEYSSFLNQKIIGLGYGHLRYSELREYIHVPAIRAYLEFNGMMHGPIVDEMRKREAWHGDQFKPIPAKHRNPIKRTAEMDNHAATELEIFISNNRELMTLRLPEYIKNVARKMKRGTYDPVQAIKLWRYLVDEAAKMYAKEYGGKWNEHLACRRATR